jgi:hypothetical protein
MILIIKCSLRSPVLSVLPRVPKEIENNIYSNAKHAKYMEFVQYALFPAMKSMI